MKGYVCKERKQEKKREHAQNVWIILGKGTGGKDSQAPRLERLGLGAGCD